MGQEKLSLRFNPTSRPIFSYSVTRSIPEGDPGVWKGLALLETGSGEYGQYFLKALFSPEAGRQQIEKYEGLGQRNLPIPKIVRIGYANDKESNKLLPYLCVTDLSENGNYMVLSANNSERYQAVYKNLVAAMNPDHKQDLKEKVIEYAQKAAQSNSSDPSGENAIYQLEATAYLLVINRQNPDDSRVLIGDFGGDIRKRHMLNQEVVMDRNLRMAHIFYSSMFEIPLLSP